MAKKCKAAGGGVDVEDPSAEDGGGDPAVKKEAKKKTVGKIDGEKESSPRMDRPGRASGGKVMAPGCASAPMATAAKGSMGPKKVKGPGY